MICTVRPTKRPLLSNPGPYFGAGRFHLIEAGRLLSTRRGPKFECHFLTNLFAYVGKQLGCTSSFVNRWFLRRAAARVRLRYLI